MDKQGPSPGGSHRRSAGRGASWPARVAIAATSGSRLTLGLESSNVFRAKAASYLCYSGSAAGGMPVLAGVCTSHAS